MSAVLFPNLSPVLSVSGLSHAYARYTRYPDSWSLSKDQGDLLAADIPVDFDVVEVRADRELTEKRPDIKQGQTMATYTTEAVRFAIKSGLAKLIKMSDGFAFYRFPLSLDPKTLLLAAKKAAAPAKQSKTLSPDMSREDAVEYLHCLFPDVKRATLGARLSTAVKLGVVLPGSTSGYVDRHSFDSLIADGAAKVEIQVTDLFC